MRATVLFLIVLLLPKLAGAQVDNLPPVAPKAAGASVIEVRKADDGGVLVLLDRGRKHGIEVGDRFVLLRNEAQVGTLRIQVVFEDIASAQVLTGAATVAAGDQAVRLGPTAPGAGRVMAITAEGDRVFVSLGSAAGVRVGDSLVITRDGRGIAELVAEEVLEQQTRARILSVSIESDGKSLGSALKPSDQVARGRLTEPPPAAPSDDGRRFIAEAKALRERAALLEAEAARLKERAALLERNAAILGTAEAGTERGHRQPQLGARLIALVAPGLFHVKVTSLEPNGPAALGGMKEGDVIEKVGAASFLSIEQLDAFLETLLHRDKTVVLDIKRGAEPRTIVVRPRARKVD